MIHLKGKGQSRAKKVVVGGVEAKVDGASQVWLASQLSRPYNGKPVEFSSLDDRIEFRSRVYNVLEDGNFSKTAEEYGPRRLEAIRPLVDGLNYNQIIVLVPATMPRVSNKRPDYNEAVE